MKKIVMLFLVLLPLAGLTQRFNGGITAGGLVSQVDGDNNQGYHHFGYLVGGLVSLKVSDHSSFQMEMEYIQKGARANADTLTNTGTTYLFRLHYFEIPILYQYTFAKRFQAEVGPVADVLLGSTVEENGQPVDNYKPYRKVTLSGIAGISCFLSDHLKAGLRFNYSLLSIRSEVVPGARKLLFERGQYNNVLSLSLSWYFKPRDY